jgi:hypothetical protein
MMAIKSDAFAHTFFMAGRRVSESERRQTVRQPRRKEEIVFCTHIKMISRYITEQQQQQQRTREREVK